MIFTKKNVMCEISLQIEYDVVPRGKVDLLNNSMLYDITCKQRESSVSCKSVIDLYIPENRIDYFSLPTPHRGYDHLKNSWSMLFSVGDNIQYFGTFIDLTNHAKMKYITNDGLIMCTSLDSVILLCTFNHDLKIYGVRSK